MANAAKAQLPEGHFQTFESLILTVYFLLDADLDGDLDNAVKPIQDSLCALVYADDRQIRELHVVKYINGEIGEFTNPHPSLIDALKSARPLVYVQLEMVN